MSDIHHVRPISSQWLWVLLQYLHFIYWHNGNPEVSGETARLIYRAFLKKGNRSSKVSSLKHMIFHTIYFSFEERVTLWLSFDILRASSLPRITELEALEGNRYKIFFLSKFWENQTAG